MKKLQLDIEKIMHIGALITYKYFGIEKKNCNLIYNKKKCSKKLILFFVKLSFIFFSF